EHLHTADDEQPGARIGQGLGEEHEAADEEPQADEDVIGDADELVALTDDEFLSPDPQMNVTAVSTNASLLPVRLPLTLPVSEAKFEEKEIAGQHLSVRYICDSLDETSLRNAGTEAVRCYRDDYEDEQLGNQESGRYRSARTGPGRMFECGLRRRIRRRAVVTGGLGRQRCRGRRRGARADRGRRPR